MQFAGPLAALSRLAALVSLWLGPPGPGTLSLQSLTASAKSAQLSSLCFFCRCSSAWNRVFLLGGSNLRPRAVDAAVKLSLASAGKRLKAVCARPVI